MKMTKLTGQFILGGIASLVLLFLLYRAHIFPDILRNTDILIIFYAAGQKVKEGKCLELYLPEGKNPLFPYPPLIAFLCESLVYLPVPLLFKLWQIISLLSLVFSVVLMSSLMQGMRWSSCFLYSLLFLPVFYALWVGQISLVVLCLPLALGYFLFMKNQPIKAGLAWSLLILKPQFLFIPVLFLISTLKLKNTICWIGLAAGLFILSVCNIICLGPAMAYKWLSSIRLEAAALLNPADPRMFQMSSLYEGIVQFIPYGWLPLVNPVLYLSAAVLFVYAWLYCTRLLAKAGSHYMDVLPIVFAIAILTAPLVLPYFRFYDLSIFVLAALILTGHPIARFDKNISRDMQLAWCLIDLYLVVAVFASHLVYKLFLPFFLALTLVWIYFSILKRIKRFAGLANPGCNGPPDSMLYSN